MTILRTKGLRKYFPVRRSLPDWLMRRDRRFVKACDGVDLDIQAGATLGLVGESGSGKSTLGLTLLLLHEPTGGQVIFQEQDLTAASPQELRKLRRQMQIVFQDPFSSLNPRFTLAQILAHPLRTHGLVRTRKQAEEGAKGLLNLVELPAAWGHRYPHELSGGQRQRVSLARAIALRPKFIVLDEPVSALDVSVQAQMLNLFKRLQLDLGLTYLFITHDLRVVKHVSSRVAVMYAGKIVEQGDAEDVYARPHHPYTQALLSSIPLPVVGLKRERTILSGEPIDPIDLPPGCRFQARCSYATKECTEAESELREVAPGHLSRCTLDWR